MNGNHNKSNVSVRDMIFAFHTRQSVTRKLAILAGSFGLLLLVVNLISIRAIHKSNQELEQIESNDMSHIHFFGVSDEEIKEPPDSQTLGSLLHRLGLHQNPQQHDNIVLMLNNPMIFSTKYLFFDPRPDSLLGPVSPLARRALHRFRRALGVEEMILRRLPGDPEKWGIPNLFYPINPDNVASWYQQKHTLKRLFFGRDDLEENFEAMIDSMRTADALLTKIPPSLTSFGHIYPTTMFFPLSTFQVALHDSDYFNDRFDCEMEMVSDSLVFSALPFKILDVQENNFSTSLVGMDLLKKGHAPNFPIYIDQLFNQNLWWFPFWRCPVEVHADMTRVDSLKSEFYPFEPMKLQNLIQSIERIAGDKEQRVIESFFINLIIDGSFLVLFMLISTLLIKKELALLIIHKKNVLRDIRRYYIWRPWLWYALAKIGMVLIICGWFAIGANNPAILVDMLPVTLIGLFITLGFMSLLVNKLLSDFTSSRMRLAKQAKGE